MSLHVFQMWYQTAGQKNKNRHKRTQKNGMKVIASGFACILPNGSAGMTQKNIKKHSVEGSKTNSGMLALKQSRQREV